MQVKLTRLEETVHRVEENATSGIQSVRAELDSAKKNIQRESKNAFRVELDSAKKDIQKESKKEFDEVKAEIKEFRTSFGRWSVPSAKVRVFVLYIFDLQSDQRCRNSIKIALSVLNSRP